MFFILLFYFPDFSSASVPRLLPSRAGIPPPPNPVSGPFPPPSSQLSSPPPFYFPRPTVRNKQHPQNSRKSKVRFPSPSVSLEDSLSLYLFQIFFIYLFVLESKRHLCTLRSSSRRLAGRLEFRSRRFQNRWLDWPTFDFQYIFFLLSRCEVRRLVFIAAFSSGWTTADSASYLSQSSVEKRVTGLRGPHVQGTHPKVT